MKVVVWASALFLIHLNFASAQHFGRDRDDDPVPERVRQLEVLKSALAKPVLVGGCKVSAVVDQGGRFSVTADPFSGEEFDLAFDTQAMAFVFDGVNFVIRDQSISTCSFPGCFDIAEKMLWLKMDSSREIQSLTLMESAGHALQEPWTLKRVDCLKAPMVHSKN